MEPPYALLIYGVRLVAIVTLQSLQEKLLTSIKTTLAIVAPAPLTAGLLVLRVALRANAPMRRTLVDPPWAFDPKESRKLLITALQFEQLVPFIMIIMSLAVVSPQVLLLGLLM
jgi:hypothetical protein